jgi:hypothetical protein
MYPQADCKLHADRKLKSIAAIASSQLKSIAVIVPKWRPRCSCASLIQRVENHCCLVTSTRQRTPMRLYPYEDDRI